MTGKIAALLWERSTSAAQIHALETELAWMQTHSGMAYALPQYDWNSIYHFPHWAIQQGFHQPSHLDGVFETSSRSRRRNRPGSRTRR